MDQDQDQDTEISHDVVAPKSQFEMEWDVFECNVLGPSQWPAATTTTTGNGANGATTATADPQETYACTMIAMELKLVPRFISLPEGAAQGQPPEDSMDHGVGGEGHHRWHHMDGQTSRSQIWELTVATPPTPVQS
ncbi:hypothetical protein F5148DRAFT_1147875 [Russula earlei]|uniref:Uncharacterized protein n=1 Tax=Russula earlei TaxID=71964 RepID=A0ACC0UGU1_9AGAM|nr:hypothetical protein F5148DRAFT_1147875 [Russula earlei]